MPGRLEVQENDPYGDKGCSMSKTNYMSRLEKQKQDLRAKLNAAAPANAENKNPNTNALVPTAPVVARPLSARSNNSAYGS